MTLFETWQIPRGAASDGVIVCWFLFAATFALRFWLRRKEPRAQESKHDHMATVGIALEGVGYCIVSSQVFRRDQFVPFVAGSQALEWGLGALAVGIAAASVGLTNAAVLRLGKQWALAARLVEGHALIQDGPYGIVRNPIYLAMFGMLLATGLVATQWIWLAVASLLFLAGTYVRVKSEERLLRGAFGGAFDEYARKVPAFIPGVY